MNVFLEKMKNFFSQAGKSIKSFFAKIGERTKEFFKNYSEKTKSKRAKKQAEQIRLKEEQKKRENEDFSGSKNEKQSDKNNKNEENSSHTEENEQKNEIAKGIRLFFMNIFDVMFEIAFFCGIFFILRPDLLNDEKISWTWAEDFDWLKAFAFIGIDKSFAEHSKTSVFIICAILAFWLLYKIIFAFVNSKRMNKIVSVLILAMSLVSILLLKDKFLVFLIFYILLFFAFQFSCRINFATSRLKCLSILVFNFFAYIILLCVFCGTFRAAIFFLYEEMHLPKKWF